MAEMSAVCLIVNRYLTTHTNIYLTTLLALLFIILTMVLLSSQHAVGPPGQMSPVKTVSTPSPAHWNIPPSHRYSGTAYANSPRGQSSSGHGAGGQPRHRNLMTQL